ncbi:MAG: Serine hydroxymethyltransferase [candidate division BRC1 bacterium ADurb.BinA364]|nr:MAG: Serine hydroxymethyltransferase [candidate division BRC1 bacterium ADurb.BinA364]
MADPSFLDAYLSKKIPGFAGADISVETVAFAAALDAVAKVEPAIAEGIRRELADQRSKLKLIASENFASPATLLAMGNWLSDKYSEGVPGHRFYAGCDNVDAIESRAAQLACSLFGADHAYAQPHSGIDANLVAFWTVLTHRVENPALERLGAKASTDLSAQDWETVRQELANQKMMGMALDAGGHLTHGFRPNISGKLFKYCSYTVDPETCVLNYDTVRQRALEEKPLLIVAGYSSYPRKINFRLFREIADEAGAMLMVDMAHIAGLVAGKVFAGDFDPVAHAHIVTTTTHKTLRGPRGGLVLCQKELAETVDRGCPLVLGGPLPHVMAAKAVALAEASRPEFREYARRVVENAAALAEALMAKGARVVTGGTENHLMLVDVRPYGLTGRQAESALRGAGLTLNRNVIPNDPNGAWYTSGLRLGTPAMTTLGMGEAEMREIADIICSTLKHTKASAIASGANAGQPSKANFELDEAARASAAARVADLLKSFPLYPEIEL